MGKCDKLVRTTLNADGYKVSVCGDGHVHVEVRTPELTGEIVLETSTDAWDLGEAIMRGFDEVEGIRRGPRKAEHP